jgi:LacI family transcriptional regulator
LRAIETLQFRPNRTARSLAQRTSRTIAVAVPTFTTPFHNELLKGVRSELDEADIDLLLCDLAWAAPKSTLRNFLERGAMDGLLLAGIPVDDEIGRELKTLGSPVILIGTQRDGMDSFYWDETAGAKLAVDHLVEQGHRRIGMIAPHVEGAIRDARLGGYRAALDAAGLSFDPELVAYGQTRKHAGFSEESGYEAMQKLLELSDPPEAIFASSDVQAIGAWQAIRHAGKSVPEDFVIMGYDDIKVSRFIGLSSVAQNMHDVGEDATALLMRRIKGSDEEVVSQVVAPELIVRKSSVRG